MIYTGVWAHRNTNEQDGWLENHIFIPVSERGRSVGALSVSVRLSHVFEYAKVRLVGDLHGRTYLEIGRYRNCGRKTLQELRDLVRQIQLGNAEYPAANGDGLHDPNIIRVSTSVRELVLKELPMSVRLENVLRTRGYTTLGELEGCDLRELSKQENCGRKTISELQQLLRRAEAGEFTPTGASTEPLTTVLAAIARGMRNIDRRDCEIVRQRLFGRNGQPKTLEEVGDRFGMTRERVRQIVKGVFEKVRRARGPILARALETIADERNLSVVPITASLVAERLSSADYARDWPELFYIYVLDQIAPFIPVWGPGLGQDSVEDIDFNEVNSTVEEWLRAKGETPTAKEAFQHLRTIRKFDRLSVAIFFSALRRARNMVVDFPRPDEARLRLRRLRLFDVAWPVLVDSDQKLTPEDIIERARARFGADAVMLSGRSAENALAAHAEIFRLGPRSFGLRQHFVSSDGDWPKLREQFVGLLAKENRPISTIEVCENQSIAIPPGMNSYELAEVLREDHRLIDLGRRLFGLAAWGIQEREHIKDLLPKILSEADRPLTASEMYDRLMKFRSATATGLSNILREHPEISRLDFGYYGLRRWGDSCGRFFVAKRSIVERAVRRVDPPIRFSELCRLFKIPLKGSDADLLWKTCAGSKKLSRAPERPGEDTLLIHKAVSLEQALGSIARTLSRPATAYEFEWELRAKFGDLFGNVGLRRIEERLEKSSRFIRDAAGAFFLDVDLDVGEFDVNAIRAAAAKEMRKEREILSSDDLLERLESQGFDLEQMTRGMLASILRGSEELEEVGRERFRTK